MVRTHALVKNNIVEKVEGLDENQVIDCSRSYDLVIDVEDLVLKPSVGWVLNGNQLVPNPQQAVNLPALINARILFYQEQAPQLLRDLYVQNTLAGITVSQSDQMFDDFQDVLIRLREGAWPTALSRLSQKQPSGFVTQTLINTWISLIQSRMV